MNVTDGMLGRTEIEDLAWLVEADFREMPDMRLTHAQISRLCNIDHEACGRVLDYLVSLGRLHYGADDRFYSA